MLRVKKINSALGKKVYTDAGDFFGEVEEAILAENKVDSWRIRIARDMVPLLNGARGVIIPHQFVKAIGDVFVINRANLPISDEEELTEEESVDLSDDSVNVDLEQ